MTTSCFFDFKQKRHFFNELLKTQLESSKNTEELKKTCLYALNSGGKRLRPLIVYLIADSLSSTEKVDEVALCVEFFHTASLIADDLPCMDNEKERRNQLTTHQVFGEDKALLSSYALIVAAFEKIGKARDHSLLEDKNIRALVSYQLACKAAGIQGATGGQFLDLVTKEADLALLEEVIYKKTVTLFEIAFCLGWIFSGGDLGKLEIVKKAAYYFGFAFQLIDDVKDYQKDLEKNKRVNLAHLLTKEGSIKKIKDFLENFEKEIECLNIKKEGLISLKNKALFYLEED